MKLYLLLFLCIPTYESGMLFGGCLNKVTAENPEQDKKNIDELITTVNERINQQSDLNVPMKNWSRQAPLHRASYYNQTALVKRLLEANANPNIQDDNGETPLHSACHRCALPDIQLLLRHGADPNIISRFITLTTPLQTLLSEPELIKIRNEDKKRAVTILLVFGANPLIPNGFGRTCFEICKQPDLATMLKRIFYHKKQAYAWLLNGKNNKNYSQFRRLPQDLLKHIIDSICPGYKDFPWPKETIPVDKMLEYLQSNP